MFIVHAPASDSFSLFYSTCRRREVARSIEGRTARITEQVRRTRGVIDDEAFQTLLADDES